MKEAAKKDMSHYTVSITVLHEDSTTEELTQQRLSELMGSTVSIRNMKVYHERKAREEYLVATASGDAAFPGIMLDGFLPGEDGKPEGYYLTSAELPNDDCPFMTSQLLAGCAALESDSAVAMMAHGRRDKNDNSRRVIYVNYDLATARSQDDPELDVRGNTPNAMLTENSPATTYRYVVILDDDYIRDAQICEDPNKMEDEDSWSDYRGSAYLGIYEGRNKMDAMQKASQENDIPISLLDGIQI